MVGTAGSGDATIAGFLSALLRDMTPEQAVNAAVAVGACNVEAADTLSGVRSWDETLRRMAAGWPRRSESVTAPGWRFDDAAWLMDRPTERETNRRNRVTHVACAATWNEILDRRDAE